MYDKNRHPSLEAFLRVVPVNQRVAIRANTTPGPTGTYDYVGFAGSLCTMSWGATAELENAFKRYEKPLEMKVLGVNAGVLQCQATLFLVVGS